MVSRKSRKCSGKRSRKCRVKGGSGKFAKIFLVDVKQPNFERTSCHPYDSVQDNRDESCYNPEWVYKSGKRTNKVECKSYKELVDQENKLDKQYIDLIQKNIDAIISKGGEEGDLVENVAQSGYRTEGVYILKKKKNKLIISELDSVHDPYGHVGKDFSLGPSFPVGYWTFAFRNGAKISINGEGLESRAHWHDGEGQAEPVIKKIIKSIKKAQIVESNGKSNVTFPWGTLRFPFDQKTTLDKLKNMTYLEDKVYFHPSSKEIGVAIYPDEDGDDDDEY